MSAEQDEKVRLLNVELYRLERRFQDLDFPLPADLGRDEKVQLQKSVAREKVILSEERRRVTAERDRVEREGLEPLKRFRRAVDESAAKADAEAPPQ